MSHNAGRFDAHKTRRPVKIGEFVLGETIGVGTFATVRLARHESTGEQFAVKVIDRRKLDSEVYERQVRRESKILQALNHPNIVSIKRILKSRMCTYLFMEYVPGGELFQEIVDNIHLEEHTARRYFQQLTDAMTYAHEHGVMHRDLKPENILLDKDKRNIKITDFGMGWIREKASTGKRPEDELMTTPCGTPKYMPPELLGLRTTKRYNAAKLDVWSCGMILFACMAGYLPYTGDTGDAANILWQIRSRTDISYPEWFGEEIRDLLSGALENDPDKRLKMRELKEHSWTTGRTVPKIQLDGRFGIDRLEFESPVTLESAMEAWEI